MGWGANSWLRVTKESTYGIYDTGAAPANIAWIRLVGNNAFTVRSVPQRQIIRTADGGNRRLQVVANRHVVTGNLNTVFYPSQAHFFLDAALTLTANDLFSYTLDFFDTVQVHSMLGAKIATMTIAGTATGDYLPLTMSWLCQSRGTTTLAQPAQTLFPAENPYQHVESKGHLSIGGTTSKYSALSIAIKNTLDGTWDEDQWITACYYCGRDIDMSVRLQYLTTAMRADLEAQTPLTVTAAWARAAGLATSFDLKTRNYVADCGDDLPINAAAYQTIGLQTFLDPAAGTDASFTVA
jgi:Phage tail tube protein